MKPYLIGLICVVCLSAVTFGQSCLVQVYVTSPATGDGAKPVLLQSIDAARDTLEVAVASFTDDQLGDAVVRAYRRGVSVRVILAGGREGEVGSEHGRLLSAGVPVRLSDTSAVFGHRFAVVDRRILLTGTYEWTDHATTASFDSLIRFTCTASSQATAAEAFLAEFDRLWTESTQSTSAAPLAAPVVSSVSILSVDRVTQCITLLNSSDRAVDLSYWSLNDLEGQYPFPEGTVILPNDPYRICIDVFNPTNDVDKLYLDSEGDEVFLVTSEGDIIDEVVW